MKVAQVFVWGQGDPGFWFPLLSGGFGRHRVICSEISSTVCFAGGWERRQGVVRNERSNLLSVGCECVYCCAAVGLVLCRHVLWSGLDFWKGSNGGSTMKVIFTKMPFWFGEFRPLFDSDVRLLNLATFVHSARRNHFSLSGTWKDDVSLSHKKGGKTVSICERGHMAKEHEYALEASFQETFQSHSVQSGFN